MTTRIETFDQQQNTPDPRQAILWQYNNSTALVTLTNEKYAWYLTTYSIFWYSWFNQAFRLKTCNEFGASVWAIILDLPINIVQSGTGTDVFAFATGAEPFGHGPYYPSSSSTVNVNLAQARFALQLRCFQLFYRATVTNINKFMYYLFDTANTGKKCWVDDNYDMTMTYKFNFVPDGDIQYVLNSFDLLPRPAGVKISWTSVSVDVFGYAIGAYPFNQAPFEEI